MGRLTAAWASLPAAAQDALILLSMLLPAAAVGWAVTRGFRTGAIHGGRNQKQRSRLDCNNRVEGVDLEQQRLE